MVKNPDLLKIFGCGKNIASYNNWAMINGFQFISGSSSIVFSIYDATTLSKGYTNDVSLALDGMFIVLDVLGGIATTNPFLLIAAVVKTTTILRKSQMQLGIKTASPFDLDTTAMFDLKYNFAIDIEQLFRNVKSFDFMYNNKYTSYDYM